MVFKPSSGFIALAFGVIVLLEDDAGKVLVIESKAFLKFILHDLGVELPIHLSINLASILNSLPQHTAPHHQRSTRRTQRISWDANSPRWSNYLFKSKSISQTGLRAIQNAKLQIRQDTSTHRMERN